MTDDRAHILVMNDAQEIIDLLRDLLEDEGYRVSASIYVLDLNRVKELAPDVMVLDIMFAGQNKGWLFLTMARLDPQVRQVPIILCTADVDTVENLGEQLERLDVQVVYKPFELEQLTDAIDAALPPAKRRPVQ
jgi:CheY-like chemotaxis protein